ncbi:nucleotidyltransferase domain-containing protein [Agarivorans aestuarii]|uniref:Nucleotidyltransferase domain-containing protein n=1 Tax=Agarivorans aestuarii TaxID=1563703 RepID=A0ABU7G359_9ALTE|nr:nucleotidyltransferase domain-containing protein [Agarivorans aestuarii]MEE1673822.1 nucleotidyltransferase domain-containing protein [Agarivorans aestuarii]
MSESTHFLALVDELSALAQVDAILLAGSRASGLADDYSDYDVYVYLNAPLAAETRQDLVAKHCQYLELNNQFWETEDDGVLLDGIEIELIYRDFAFLENELHHLVERHQAKVGYSTCFWANLLDSKILYDASGQAKRLQQRFEVTYPSALQQAIINKNAPLLMQQMPAYYFQLAKALKRQDSVSLNHRCAEFLASYFDILFAINALPHPGEKRMLEYAELHCNICPDKLTENVERLLAEVGQVADSLLDTVSLLSETLQQVVTTQTSLTWPAKPQ